ncbi:MAG: adenylyltransferase/cytidyltransferase family protein [Actinomycetales bacterium]|nr:adenylyltransferase/cytidyltransferase family protein [Actinomycetales bacterium]
MSQREGTRIGYAPGVYDLFHVGHLNILKHAREHCDVLVAGVVSDQNALAVKGRAPVIPLAERIEIVRSLTIVDEAVAETWPDKLSTWRHVGFDVIFKGDDWRGTPKGDRLERDMASVGVEVHYFPYTVHTSSTLLRAALNVLESPVRTDAAV